MFPLLWLLPDPPHLSTHLSSCSFPLSFTKQKARHRNKPHKNTKNENQNRQKTNKTKKKAKTKQNEKKELHKILLSSFCVGSSRACGYPEGWLVYPVTLHWRKLTSIASEHLLQIASGLGLGLCVHFPFSVLGPHVTGTCVHPLPAAAVSVSSYVWGSCVRRTLFPWSHPSPSFLIQSRTIWGWFCPQYGPPASTDKEDNPTPPTDMPTGQSAQMTLDYVKLEIKTNQDTFLFLKYFWRLSREG